jgi:DNA-binding MarR family transcriptional regulator
MTANGPLPQAVADVVEHIGRRLQKLAYSENLNPAQWTLLRFLARSNPSARTPSGFARFHLTTKSAATQTVDALLRKKLIRTGTHPHDQRAKLLELTPKGYRVLRSDPRNILVTALEKLPEADLHHLARLASALAHDLYLADGRASGRTTIRPEEHHGTHIGDRGP